VERAKGLAFLWEGAFSGGWFSEDDAMRCVFSWKRFFSEMLNPEDTPIVIVKVINKT
jgi:hypothetical protein